MRLAAESFLAKAWDGVWAAHGDEGAVSAGLCPPRPAEHSDRHTCVTQLRPFPEHAVHTQAPIIFTTQPGRLPGPTEDAEVLAPSQDQGRPTGVVGASV